MGGRLSAIWSGPAHPDRAALSWSPHPSRRYPWVSSLTPRPLLFSSILPSFSVNTIATYYLSPTPSEGWQPVSSEPSSSAFSSSSIPDLFSPFPKSSSALTHGLLVAPCPRGHRSQPSASLTHVVGFHGCVRGGVQGSDGFPKQPGQHGVSLDLHLQFVTAWSEWRERGFRARAVIKGLRLDLGGGGRGRCCRRGCHSGWAPGSLRKEYCRKECRRMVSKTE